MPRALMSCGLLAPLAVAAVAASATRSEAAPQRRAAKPVVTCTPCCDAEFVNDLKLRNVGTVTIPKGTYISWRVGGYTWTGAFFTTRDFVHGQELVLRGVLNGAQNQSPCTATVQEKWETFTYSLSPATLTLTVGEEATILVTPDHSPAMYTAGVSVEQSGPAGLILQNGETRTAISFSSDSRLPVPVRVKGIKPGGPVLVSVVGHEYFGGPAVVASTRVTVRLPLSKQPVKH